MAKDQAPPETGDLTEEEVAELRKIAERDDALVQTRSPEAGVRTVVRRDVN